MQALLVLTGPPGPIAYCNIGASDLPFVRVHSFDVTSFETE